MNELELKGVATMVDAAYLNKRIPALNEMTFEGLLSMLSTSDDALVMVDPVAIVGELRGKVDSIKFVIDHLEALSAYYKKRIEPLTVKKRACDANIESLKRYVAEQMVKHNFDKVPGDEWRIQLQPNPPALEILEPATEAHRDLFPEYTETVTEIRWRQGKLKDDLLSGVLPADSCPFAKIRQGSHARFYVHTPERLPLAKKEKKA